MGNKEEALELEQNMKIEQEIETLKEQIDSFTSKEKVAPNLVDLLRIDSNFLLDIRYSSQDNFTGSCVYQSKSVEKKDQAFLVENAAIALSKANQEFSSKYGYQIKVWDAYRPFRYQQVLYDLASDKKYVADPSKGSIHNRACAVDITLVRRKEINNP